MFILIEAYSWHCILYYLFLGLTDVKFTFIVIHYVTKKVILSSFNRSTLVDDLSTIEVKTSGTLDELSKRLATYKRTSGLYVFWWKKVFMKGTKKASDKEDWVRFRRDCISK